MPITITGVLAVIGGVCLLVGVVLSRHALARHRSPSAPSGVSWHVGSWRPVWRNRDWFVGPKGFNLYVAGTLLMSAGALLVFLALILRP